MRRVGRTETVRWWRICSSPTASATPTAEALFGLGPVLAIADGVTPVLSTKDEAAPSLSEAAAQGLLPRYDACLRYYAKLASGT